MWIFCLNILFCFILAEVNTLSKESEKNALNDAPSLRPSTDGNFVAFTDFIK